MIKSGECIEECPDNWYNDGHYCAESCEVEKTCEEMCSEKCESCFSDSKYNCISCKEGYYFSEIGQTCVDLKCDENEYIEFDPPFFGE